MIPLILRLRGRRINLFLPLFLLWILLLPLAFLLFVVWACLRIFGGRSAKITQMARLIEAGVNVLWRLHGLQIHIRSADSLFILHF